MGSKQPNPEMTAQIWEVQCWTWEHIASLGTRKDWQTPQLHDFFFLFSEGVEDTEPDEKLRHFLHMANVSEKYVILGRDDSQIFD